MTLHVETAGPADGRPVLLLHGGGVGAWMWRPLLDATAGRISAVAPDLPGHGRSAGEPYRSHAETTALLEPILRALAARGRQVAVVGFSLGGQLAIRLAAAHPDLVDTVLAVSAQAVPLPGERATLALVGATSGLARRPGFARAQARQLGLPATMTEDFVRSSSTTTRDSLVAAVSANLAFRPPADWSDFHGTARVVVGSRERRVIRSSATALVEANPRARRIDVDGCAHDIPWRRPDVLADLLLEEGGR